jgi:hypothetical protein
LYERLFLFVPRRVGLADGGSRIRDASSEQSKKIGSKHEAQNQQDKSTAQSKVYAAKPKASAASAGIAVIFYVGALPSRCPFQTRSPWLAAQVQASVP